MCASNPSGNLSGATTKTKKGREGKEGQEWRKIRKEFPEVCYIAVSAHNEHRTTACDYWYCYTKVILGHSFKFFPLQNKIIHYIKSKLCNKNIRKVSGSMRNRVPEGYIPSLPQWTVRHAIKRMCRVTTLPRGLDGHFSLGTECKPNSQPAVLTIQSSSHTQSTWCLLGYIQQHTDGENQEDSV